MSSIPTWGRKESWIWPPRGFYYTYGAIFITCVLCAFFVYLRFEFGLSPLQRYYLPYTIRTWTSGWRALCNSNREVRFEQCTANK